jgi:hypothetical protein
MTMSATPARQTAAPRWQARAPASPGAAAALEDELGRCTQREAAARLGVYLAGTYAAGTALFAVHRGLIQGICSEGMADQGSGLLFPSDAPSLFAEVVASGWAVRSAPPERPLDRRILRVLGRQHVREIAVLPVMLRGRAVNLLYADNGPEALGAASVAALSAVCDQIADAYRRVILAGKRVPGSEHA